MILVFVVSIFSLIFILYILLPYIWSRALRVRQKKRAISQKTVFLTFDDGPGNRLTPQILNVLREKGIKATFFILSRNILGREEILRSIAVEGHLIASHSYSHFNAWKVAPWRAIKDMKRGWNELKNTLPAYNRILMYRPPCGKMNLITLFLLWCYKIPTVFWTVDCLDTWPESQRDVHYAARRIQEDKGGIVLFHDFDRGTNHLDSYVLNSLEEVIEQSKKLNLKFATTDNLLEQG